ncbi:MAG: hypothetical protein HYY26_01550, partial [Acidobacteria bacterium]|nr:hypothetical protein [Acidobacteriota bacterium]
MLRLRQVELFGFKSFADRTRIVFGGTGIAAVVGPNGCGKSNIADAILWVLGEQSAKTLRSARMADCIFNGTASRPPTNLAEVTLTLYDPEAEQAPVAPAETPAEATLAQPQGEAAADEEPKKRKGARSGRLNLRIQPGEVVVTRRLYRDGTSEYYLNGELCRLRDIQELFMGTGLGPESYAIIEQGRVGQILSSRPSDRRALLEEAAGVSKYKTKRRLAEAKLESAHQNLLRVNDILEEISKQLNSLKRQAARARRYQELKAEVTHLHRQLLATQLEQLQTTAAALAAQLEANAADASQQAAELARLEQEQAAAQARQYELETTLRQEQNRAGQVLLEVERAQTRLAETRRQQEETADRLATLASEREKSASEATSTTAALDAARAQTAQLEEELQRSAAELERLATEADSARQRIAALEAARAALDAQQAEAPDRRLALSAERAQLEHLAQSAADELRRFAAEREVARLDLERLATQEQQLASALAQARGEQARAQENVAAAEHALAATQADGAAQQRRLDQARQSLADAAAQEHALADLVAQRAALAEPVQKLLVGAGGMTAVGGFRAVGVVADFTEFDPGYAPLLEDYLHDELEYVVVETYDAARTGVSLLREQVGGRATFLVDSFGRFPATLRDDLERPQGSGIVARVADLVRINGPLGSEAKRVLPKLSRTYLVHSAETAEALARDFPHFFFLSTDGSCYHGRLVSGGVRNGHGSHALQRELERAAARRTEVEPSVAEEEAELARLEARRRELENAVAAARQALFAQEKNLLQLEQQRDALTAERTRAEQEAARAATACAELETRQRATAERLEALRAELTELEQLLGTGEHALKANAQQLLEQRQALETATTQFADLRARHAAGEERLAAARQELARLEQTAARLAELRREQAALETRFEAEQQRLAEELLAREAELLQRREEKSAQEARCQQYEEELSLLRQSLLEREAALRERRAAHDALRERRHQLEVEQARLASDRQHAELALQNEFGLTAEQLLVEVTERLAGDALAQAELRYREIRQRLDTLGPINMMALEEFQECEQRHEFLTKQRDDRLASIADTRRTIEEFDTVSAQLFNDAFIAINRNFEETFRTLFG